MPHRKKVSQQRQWRRMDLHLHTPASADYKQPNVTYLDFLKKADERNLDIVAFTDHNSVIGYAHYLEEVESLELLERLGRLREDERQRLKEHRELREKLLILPGLEFTATLGFHVLGIFPPETTVRELEHLLLMLRVPPDKLDQGSGEVGATSDVLTAYRMINEAGGLVIAAHANSSHGVAMPGFDFGGQTRIAYTQDPNLHALEVTDLDSKSRRRTAMFFNGTKPEYPRRMHCIQGSDAHKLDFDARYKNEMGVGDRATEILLSEVSFDAIREVLLGNDYARTRPSRLPTEEPFDPIREAREQGDTLVQSFHERLHERRGISHQVLEDIVALANTNGGNVYIGVSSNSRAVVSGVDRPEQASAELRAAVSKDITPPLDIQVDVLKSQNKSVLQVIVPRGSQVPYALEGSHIYVRSENETTLAHRDEIVQLVRDALAVELAATMPSAVAVEHPQVEPVAEPGETPAVAPAAIPALDPPRTGVEIVSSDVRKGVTYYAVRDLRNGRIVQNVTRSSARRLWQYAIEEKERGVCEPDKIAWAGNVGICKTNKRGGKTRYDLVQRVDGRLLIYYGVTEDGIHGPWRALVETETGGGAEETESEAPLEAFTAEEAAAQFETAPVAKSFSPAEPEPATAGEPFPPEPASEQMETQGSFLPMIVPEEAGENLPTAEAAPANEQALPPEMASAPQDAGAGPQSVAAEPQSAADEPQSAADEPQSAADEPQSPEAQPQSPAAQARGETIAESRPMPETPAAPEPLVEWSTADKPAAAQTSAEPASSPAAAPSAPKTRAQQWREILDRAIAEARAAQTAKEHPESRVEVPEAKEKEKQLEQARAEPLGEDRAVRVIQSEVQASEIERRGGEKSEPGGANPENGSNDTDNPGNGA